MGAKESLTGLGARIRQLLLDDPRAGDELRDARAEFLEEVERRNAASNLRRPSALRRRRWLPLVLSASVALGTAVVWLWPRAVTFQISGARQGQLGDVIEASKGGVLPLSFSDGSTLVLQHGGRIRVLSLQAGAARVLVEDGVVDATIAHRRGSKTRWDFELGPYRVTVNGTRFRMSFRASDLALRVSTEEGRVTVAGGCLEAAKTVSAGESLEPSCPRPAPQPADTAADEEEVLLPAPHDDRPADGAIRVDRWRELLAAGRLLDGLHAAERANFDQVCRVATAKELLALADAGRFFGVSRRAVTALGALRKRFSGSADARTAAFMLGRIAFDDGHAYADAAHWFETYLLEEPRGALMGDAFGRLMEARLRSGDSPGARASAEQYLRRFPEGPYASEARGILSR